MEQQKMDKKSKVLIIIFFALLLGSVLMTYKRTIIDKDFYIKENTEPEQEI